MQHTIKHTSSILILMFLLFAACKSNLNIEQDVRDAKSVSADQATNTENTTTENLELNQQDYDQVVSQELPKLKKLVQQLSDDYKPILTLEDMVAYMIVDDKEAYLRMYQDVLDKMDYMTADFKNELLQEIRNSQVDNDGENLRLHTDPLFKAELALEEIVFLGSDIEADEAVIFVELAVPLIDAACCKTTLNFRKIGHDWMLTGRSIDLDNHAFIFRNIEDYIGLYHHENNPNNSYAIAKEGDIFVLKYCTPQCSLVGEINGIEHNEGDQILHLKNPKSNNAPSFRFNEKTLHVRKFDESTQQWKEEVYQYKEGEG